ncbi:MAG: SBBP repeat-containing protein, partial [Candidatus Zixiibacteriota bacterium]
MYKPVLHRFPLIALALLALSPSLGLTEPIPSRYPVFVENMGQWNSTALFRASLPEADVWISAGEVRYDLTRRIARPATGSKPNGGASSGAASLRPGELRAELSARLSDMTDGKLERLTVSAKFIGASRITVVRGEGALARTNSYFLGRDHAGWRVGVPSYSAVIHQDIYPNINLRYFHNGENLEYELIASPGADLSQIRIGYDGIESLALNAAGDLEVRSSGTVVMSELAPVLYQFVDGRKVEMRGRFELAGANQFSIVPPQEYDPGLALIIDPVVTFNMIFGGSGQDDASDVAIDSNGDLYITGSTRSADFPTTAGLDTSYNGGMRDAFVTKLSGADHSIIYSSFLGGGAGDTALNGQDLGRAIAVDQSGAVYIAGVTASQDFPILNAFQSVHPGIDPLFGFNKKVVFMCKITPGGDELEYSTFLYGSETDQAEDICIDQTGAATVVGWTTSGDFPLKNPYDGANSGLDIFLTKLSPAGNSILYSTFLGGDGSDVPVAVALDPLGQYVVSGWTTSVDYPLVNEIEGPNLNAAGVLIGTPDVTVTRFSADGSSLVHSSYIGGAAWDQSHDAAMDQDGAVYVTGVTQSPDFTTRRALDISYDPVNFAEHVQDFDGFVTKIGAAGELVYSTYHSDAGTAIAVNAQGVVYVTRSGWFTKLCSAGSAILARDTLAVNSSRMTAIEIGSDGSAQIVGFTLVSNALLIEVPATPDFVCGDADNSCEMNISDVTFLIARLFAGGAAPVYADAADPTGDGRINVADVTRLISRIFA